MLFPFFGHILLSKDETSAGSGAITGMAKLTLVTELARIIITADLELVPVPFQPTVAAYTIEPMLDTLLTLLPHCAVAATCVHGGSAADSELAFVLQVSGPDCLADTKAIGLSLVLLLF